MTYNPFDKTIDSLTAEDLDILIKNEITEGYWIEYKREFQQSSKISKSIASLANTYGGWYFIGVEADKSKNVAVNICGFNLIDVTDPISKLREIVKSNIDPLPLFHSKLIEISTGKGVLVVHIPDNQETPFITKDGRIYRRVSDSSDPVPEDNRYAIDRLVDSGRDIESRFTEFCKDERTFSQGEANQAWVNIFISPYPMGTIYQNDIITSDGIERLIKLSRNPIKIILNSSTEIGAGNLPFNSGQLTFGSVILKPEEPSKVALNSLSAELFLNGRAKFFIPLKYMASLHQMNIDELKSSQVKQAIMAITTSDKEYSAGPIRFFDIQQLWAAVITLLDYYQVVYGEALEQVSSRLVITMDRVWRLSPFCDVDEWGIYVQKFGLPVQSVNFVRIPNDKKSAVTAEFPLWTTVCSYIGLGFGLPIDLFSNIIARVGK